MKQKQPTKAQLALKVGDKVMLRGEDSIEDEVMSEPIDFRDGSWGVCLRYHGGVDLTLCKKEKNK